jgi:hypothetical protein
MNSLMNSIDTIKQKITDAEYKELCDKMMELNNNKKKKKETDFYEIMYIEPYITERVVGDRREYQVDVKIIKRIVKMNMSETDLDYANDKIKEFGRWDPHRTTNKAIKDIIDERQTHTLISREDETIDGTDVENYVYTSESLSIMSIKKL